MLADLLQSTFALHRARITCLATIAHRFVQGQNRQSGPTRHRFPKPRRPRFALPTPATLLQACPTPTCSPGIIRARFPTRYPLHLWLWIELSGSLGKRPINFLILSVVHDGIAFPLLWKVLAKRGNSNTQERIALMGRFLEVVGHDKIDCLVADREFIGAEWFAWLSAHHIAFHLRIRHDMKVSRTTGVLAPARNFFRSLPRSTSCCLIGPRLVCGHWLWVSGIRLPDGAYLIVVSNRTGHQALERYKRRWQIEVLFEALKSRGFDFEATRLREAERLETLCGVLAIAFCWAWHVGAWQHKAKPIALKTHQRLAKSLFRYGFDGIRQAVLNATDKWVQFERLLSLLWKVLTAPKAILYSR